MDIHTTDVGTNAGVAPVPVPAPPDEPAPATADDARGWCREYEGQD